MKPNKNTLAGRLDWWWANPSFKLKKATKGDMSKQIRLMFSQPLISFSVPSERNKPSNKGVTAQCKPQKSELAKPNWSRRRTTSRNRLLVREESFIKLEWSEHCLSLSAFNELIAKVSRPGKEESLEGVSKCKTKGIIADKIISGMKSLE